MSELIRTELEGSSPPRIAPSEVVDKADFRDAGSSSPQRIVKLELQNARLA